MSYLYAYPVYQFDPIDLRSYLNKFCNYPSLNPVINVLLVVPVVWHLPHRSALCPTRTVLTHV